MRARRRQETTKRRNSEKQTMKLIGKSRSPLPHCLALERTSVTSVMSSVRWVLKILEKALRPSPNVRNLVALIIQNTIELLPERDGLTKQEAVSNSLIQTFLSPNPVSTPSPVELSLPSDSYLYATSESVSTLLFPLLCPNLSVL